MTSSLVGSEMCIRDSKLRKRARVRFFLHRRVPRLRLDVGRSPLPLLIVCLLYTSDAADDM
eukprot:3418893-Prorocentrum_lima.AAC.1